MGNEKSSKLKNLFSSPPDLQKLFQVFLIEQRHQRADLQTLLQLGTKILNEIQLQKQVDDFYETSHQTDTEEQLHDNSSIE